MITIKSYIIVTILAIALLPSPSMSASVSGQMNVTATTVSPIAAINIIGSLAFGSVQDTHTAQAQYAFSVMVSRGFPYAIAMNGGSNYISTTGKSFMKDGKGENAREYALYQDAGRSTAWQPNSDMTGLTGTGAAQAYIVYGSLFAAPGTSGAISDTVAITVAY